MEDPLRVMENLERAVAALEEASRAAIALAKAQMEEARARTADDDQWTRMPRVGERCPATGLSRSTIIRHINSKKARSKLIGGTRFFAAADILALNS